MLVARTAPQKLSNRCTVDRLLSKTYAHPGFRSGFHQIHAQAGCVFAHGRAQQEWAFTTETHPGARPKADVPLVIKPLTTPRFRTVRMSPSDRRRQKCRRA
jgi:hypothetical protein